MTAKTSRLCGGSFIHAQQTLAQGLDLVGRLGFSNVDIGVGGGNAHYNPIEVALHPVRYADEVRHETEARGLSVNECFALNFGVPLNTNDKADRERTRDLFRGLCNFAARAKFRSVMLIAGPPIEEKFRRYTQELAAEALCELSEIAGEKELLLNLEADSESCVNTPEEARDLCGRVPKLGLTLDHSHFICQGIAPERIELLYPYTRHLHIRQSAPGCIVTAVDEGVVDFAEVLKKLALCNYCGLYCIEYLSLSTDEAALREAESRTLAMKERINALMGNSQNL